MAGYTAVSNASGPISYLRHQCEAAEVDFNLASDGNIWFYNRGKRLVRIDGMPPTVHYLEPKEVLDLPWNFMNGVPSVVSLNNAL